MKRFQKIILIAVIMTAGFGGRELLAQTESVAAVHDDMTKQAIRDRVRVLREERHQSMPYLDRAYIRQSIHPDKVREKIDFISGESKHLDDLIARAVRVHTPARASRERISLAKRRILVALRKLFPEVNYELERRGGFLSGDAFNSRHYKFSFRQPFFRGGILWNSLLKEKAELEAAEKEYEKTISDVIYDVSTAYFEYNRSLQVIEDQQTTLTALSRFVKISEQKYAEQIISEIEHLNTRSLFSQMQYDYETSKQEFELAKLDLQRYLDLMIQDQLAVAGFYDSPALIAQGKTFEQESAGPLEQGDYFFEKDIKVPALPELVDLAYFNRAELQIEAAKLQSARLEERIRWGEMMPQADLVLEFGKLGEAFDVNSLKPGFRRDYRFMLELNWNAGGNKMNYTFDNSEDPPTVTQFLGGAGSTTRSNKFTAGLFDGLEELAEAKEAEVSKLEQIVELEKAEKEVVQEIKQGFFDFQKASIQVKSTLQRFDYRERLAKLAEHRLGQNEIQISEYLQAEIDLLREKTELHKALKDYFDAKAKLNRAVGKRDFLPVKELHGTE